VALIVFLAHVGSFVPAASARVGLVDRIFTRLASREAAALPQSAFMLDLTQVAAMLRLSTERWAGTGVGEGSGLERNRLWMCCIWRMLPGMLCTLWSVLSVLCMLCPPCPMRRSLCIIDEFGKGTLAADGVGLLCATLRHFATLPRPPRVVLCTHFRQVRGWAKLCQLLPFYCGLVGA
jgi:DNA mismatch repair protein MSH5